MINMIYSKEIDLLHALNKCANEMEKVNENLQCIANILKKSLKTEKEKAEELRKKKLEYNLLQFLKDMNADLESKKEYEKETAEWLNEKDYHLDEFTKEDEERMQQLEKEIQALENEME